MRDPDTEKVTMPPDFDWVKARAECSPARVFQQMKLAVEGDVKIRNETLPANAQFWFVALLQAESVAVFSDGPARRRASVEFRQSGHGILVRDETGKTIHEAILTLNNEGECILKIADEEYEFWQFRKLALESLFFPLFDAAA